MFSALGEKLSQKLKVINKYHNNQAFEISVSHPELDSTGVDPDLEISCLKSLNVLRMGLRRHI